MATFQTKLSLDIPSNIAPQSSPSLLPYENSAPPSPTLSGSWSVNKSHTELTLLLQEAYAVIREREKDLTLAAEIGKSLLENNIALKGKYDGAIVQLQNLQREFSKAQNFSLQHQDYEDQRYRDLEKIKSLESKNKDIQHHLDEALREFSECDESNKSRIRKLESDLAFATHKIEDLERENDLFVQNVTKSEAELTEGGKSLTLATEIGKSLLENINNDHQDYKELEFVKELETQNQELQQKLDEAIEEYNDRDKLNKSQICKLESELHRFKDACSLSTLKIESLEKEIERLVKKPEADSWNPKCIKKSNEKITVRKLISSYTYGVPQNIVIF